MYFLRDVDIENVLVSNKIAFGEKKTINILFGYLYDDYKTKPLHIMRAYVKSYDGQTKWMYFLIEDDDLLEKYNTIWDKISADIKKEFDSEPVSNKKFLKTKKKLLVMKLDFHDEEMAKAGSHYTCLTVINADSTL